MLTTVTTIIGLSPMALSLSIDFINREIGHGNLTSSWWIPLSTAIIFGLGFATLLTLVLTPVLLALPDVYRRKYADWRASRRRSRANALPGQPAITTPSRKVPAD
jgi:multidrug efflux pump